jgi:hypothetical protein
MLKILMKVALLGSMTAAITTVPITAHAAPGYQAARGGGACAFVFNKEPYLLHQAVVIGGQVECHPAPLAFHLEMQLFHQSGTGSPQPMGEGAVVTQIPNPRVQVATMALDCVRGLWQGRIVMQATWDTGPDEARRETPWTIINC